MDNADTRGVGMVSHAAIDETEGLASDDFTRFFRDVHGYAPFPWQQRLTAQVLTQGAWPRVIDLPTGTGKTAVLDTAVFALAVRPAISPRRVVFVIDRRIVVDQVYERAQRLQDRIMSGATPVLQQVQDRLRVLSGGEPLGVAVLRGGIPIDNEWAQRPDQPWVMVSTVDQFGSRLLFRGYGVNPGMRPIHAGLAGNDCLVILDEVHLSVPFAETLAQIQALRAGPLSRRFAVVEMSATPSDQGAERFTLNSADLNDCEELRRRIAASKQAKLESTKNPDSVPGAVLKIIHAMDKPRGNADHEVRCIGVIVNRVRTARETYRALVDADHAACLITGRMRPLDRGEVLDSIRSIVDPDLATQDGNRLVVVGTQAVEVGADFSFDALITECASVDSLRQRFGRLDRRGAHFYRVGQAAQAWILGLKSVVDAKKPDPIYGESVKATWKELKRRAEHGPIDVGSTSLQGFPHDTTAPRSRAPLLLKTHLDSWTQTRPEPIVQPSIEWFLHGIGQDQPADVSIIWRWDRSTEALRLVPPRQAEFLQVPLHAAKSWLSGGKEVEIADVTHSDESEISPSPSASPTGDWLRWEGFEDGANEIQVKDVRPGDILVVNPEKGGLSAGTWDPSSTEAVTDLGDAAQMAYGRRATLRLDRRLPDIHSPPAPADEIEADRPTRDRIIVWLRLASQTSDWLREIRGRLGRNFAMTPVNDYYVLTERLVEPTSMDGSDVAGSLTGTGARLDHHLHGVGERAGRIAKRLGMPPAIVEDVRLAGRLHDLGKVDPRFQLRLVGSEVDMAMQEHPLAKSRPGVRWNRQAYPKGMRHEVASVAMIQSNRDVLNPAHDKDLVLHLVGTHHGWGRPLPPIIEDPEPHTLSYVFDGHFMAANSDLADSPLALDMADRFWRLMERYGYHGLAWLEAILRLADHQQSAEEVAQA